MIISPLISMICEINKIPYLSWIYDCPQSVRRSPCMDTKRQ
ncbi:hypothetical protein IMSAGC019_01527 [Lachnospiraceae bacterium]|nr:hypothetical protein IMSAGC019_01527 [Lachnospiraceae bacterium]